MFHLFRHGYTNFVAKVFVRNVYDYMVVFAYSAVSMHQNPFYFIFITFLKEIHLLNDA